MSGAERREGGAIDNSGAPRGQSRIIIGASALAATMILPLVSLAAQTPTEPEVKAAAVYNFAKFVEWPPEALANPETPMIIGLFGKDPIASEIERTFKGKTVNGRRLVVLRFSNVQDFAYCHILFIGASEQIGISKFLPGIRNTGILTVSEAEGFARRGGVARIGFRDNRLEIEINQSAAERAGLKISSKLLKVAHVIRD